MPLITLIMSAIFPELAWMLRIVSTTSFTTFPPRSALVEACAASWLACWALPAVSFTVEVSSSMLAAVCTTAADCSSVRDERSIFPAAISDEARDTLSTP